MPSVVFFTKETPPSIMPNVPSIGPLVNPSIGLSIKSNIPIPICFANPQGLPSMSILPNIWKINVRMLVLYHYIIFSIICSSFYVLFQILYPSSTIIVSSTFITANPKAFRKIFSFTFLLLKLIVKNRCDIINSSIITIKDDFYSLGI